MLRQSAKFTIANMALIFGGLIYITGRSKSLIMFEWFNSIGISTYIEYLRKVANVHDWLNNSWICFSLPQALWLFAGITLFQVIWGNQSTKCGIIWSSLFAIAAISLEAGQYLCLIPGRFDWIDLSSMIVSCIVALKIAYKLDTKERMYVSKSK